MRRSRLLLAAAAALVLAAGCSNGGHVQPSGLVNTGSPKGSPAATPSPLRSPTADEAACFATAGAIAELKHWIDRFNSAPHGVVPLRTVHHAAFRLAALRTTFLSDLRKHGPYEGGDECLRTAAVANAFVGTSLGPSPEIRLAVLWYALLIAFYPDSPYLGEAQEYLLGQGFAAPSPGAGLAH
ncbi:MAG TPA: hypothetical protein VNN79_14580 [Actinomycetota bacterium]|nr:hypothetical protein [Actinomycetota bacterium]